VDLSFHWTREVDDPRLGMIILPELLICGRLLVDLI